MWGIACLVAGLTSDIERDVEDWAGRGRARAEVAVVRVLEKRLGALPVVAEFGRRLRIAEIVDELCPVRPVAWISHGEVIEALVANRLTAPAPMLRVHEWAAAMAVEEAYGIAPDLLNDDRIARALNAVAPQLDAITGSVGAAAITEFGVDVSRLHWDLTSISLYGAYPEADEEYPAPRWGHPKEHRPDLKQIQTGLAVSGDGGIPVFHRAYHGGAAEASQVTGAMTALKQIAGPRPFLLVGDSKLISYTNAAAMAAQDVGFVGRWPRQGSRPGCSPRCRRRRHRGGLHCRAGCDKPAAARGSYRCWKTAGWTCPARVRPIRRCIWAGSWCTPGERRRRGQSPRPQTRQRHRGPRPAGAHRREPVSPHRKRRRRPRQGNHRKAPRRGLRAHRDHPRRRRKARAVVALRPGRDRRVGRGRRLVRPADQPCPWPGQPAEVFRRYKGQHVVERRYGEFKGPLAVAPLFLKTNRRIAALITVICLALLIFCLVERQVRNALRPRGEMMTGLPGYRLTPARPTGRTIFQALADLRLIPAHDGNPALIPKPAASRPIYWTS